MHKSRELVKISELDQDEESGSLSGIHDIDELEDLYALLEQEIQKG